MRLTKKQKAVLLVLAETVALLDGANTGLWKWFADQVQAKASIYPNEFRDILWELSPDNKSGYPPGWND